MSMEQRDPPTPSEAELNRRQQRAVEYFQENERLTRDLLDHQARALIDWASYQASLVAGDPDQTDAQVDTMLQHIRKAVSHADYTALDGATPDQLVALARQALEAILQPPPPDNE